MEIRFWKYHDDRHIKDFDNWKMKIKFEDKFYGKIFEKKNFCLW